MIEQIQEQIEIDLHQDSLQSVDDVQESEEQVVESGHAMVDYGLLSRGEMVERFRALLDSGEIDTVRGDLDAIRFHFYKKLKAEEDVKRTEFIEAGGVEDDFLFEDAQELEFKGVYNRYRELRNIHNEKLEAEKQKNLEEKLKIIEELKDLAKSSESISETFHQFRTLQNRWRSIGLVPQNEVKNLWDTYHHFVELFYDYIKLNKDLRDLDFKRNLAAKIELCEKTEALLIEPSVVGALKKLQTFHEQWREIGPVTQEMRVEIWERFRAASAQVNRKHQSYFDDIKDSENKNMEDKEALCARIEEILASTVTSTNQWMKLTQEIVEMKKLWSNIGYAPRKDNSRLSKQFHSACIKFFARKREYSNTKKEEQENNLQLKQDLCVQAEALKDNTEWKTTSEEFFSLQKKWEEIGEVPIKERDAIKKRFRKACNFFFDKRAKFFTSAEAEYEKNLIAKRELIEQINNFQQSDSPKDNFEQLKVFQRAWSEIGFVHIKHKQEIHDEFRAAIDRQFEALRTEDHGKRRQAFKNKKETPSHSGFGSIPRGKHSSERSNLTRQLQKLQNDLQVWENNIGFFSKSKNSAAMIEGVQKMIEKGRADVKKLQEKIKNIDSAED